MEFVARVWKDPVWSKVISAAVLAAAAAIWAQLQGYLTFAALQHDIVAVWDFLTDDDTRPMWVILVGNALFAAVSAVLTWYWMDNKVAALRARLAKLQRASNAGPQAQKPYLSDELFGFRWRWKIAEKSGEAYGLKMYCPKCDYELQATAFDNRFNGGVVCVCENCDYEGSVGNNEPALFMNKAKLEVERRLRTGNRTEA